jgi:hypothetical protein
MKGDYEKTKCRIRTQHCCLYNLVLIAVHILKEKPLIYFRMQPVVRTVGGPLCSKVEHARLGVWILSALDSGEHHPSIFFMNLFVINKQFSLLLRA